MKAMILAAGKGERMLPLTQHCPKPLLCVGGKPLLEYWLQKLEAMPAITQIIVNAAYLGEQIEQFIATRQNKKSILVSLEPEPLETAGAIRYVLPLLGDAPFLLINSDVYCDIDLEHWLQNTRCAIGQAPSCEAFFMMVNNPKHNGSGDFCIAGDGTLAVGALEQKPLNATRISYTFAGVSVINPKLISEYPKARLKFALREVFDWALSNNKIFANHYAGFWVDVGTPQRMAELEQVLAES